MEAGNLRTTEQLGFFSRRLLPHKPSSSNDFMLLRDALCDVLELTASVYGSTRLV